MERSSGSQLPRDQGHSTGELVKTMSGQVSVLIRDELKLAQLEVASKGKQAALGAGMFGASGVVGVYGVGCLLACVIIASAGWWPLGSPRSSSARPCRPPPPAWRW